MSSSSNSAQPIVYYLTPEITIQTTVSGSALSIAEVAIFAGTQQMWSGTLMQVSPTATVPIEIQQGNASLSAGATLTLTIPTAVQQGSVLLQGTLVSGSPSTNSTTISAQVATWSAPSPAPAGV